MDADMGGVGTFVNDLKIPERAGSGVLGHLIFEEDGHGREIGKGGMILGGRPKRGQEQKDIGYGVFHSLRMGYKIGKKRR